MKTFIPAVIEHATRKGNFGYSLIHDRIRTNMLEWANDQSGNANCSALFLEFLATDISKHQLRRMF